jgi:hypothetical protein
MPAMTFPDTSLERTGVDPAVSAMVNGLPINDSRPLSDEERQAAERAAPASERVYAPASVRVPVEPLAAHRDVVNHTDRHTRERLAAEMAAEPSVVRVTRPSLMAVAGASASRSAGSDDRRADASPSSAPRPPGVAFGLGLSWITISLCSVGAWLYFRWRRDRNKPINRR